MEIIDIITKLISNVGFPIACCIVMFYQNSKLKDCLERNTQVLGELKDKIEK